MNSGRKILLWAPRVLLVAFALFLVIFSFDVFEQGKGAMETGIALVVHNIPSMIVGLVVFAAWRREWIGVMACLVLAIAWIVWALGRFPLVTYFIMTGPLFIVAVLYAANWQLRRQTNRST